MTTLLDIEGLKAKAEKATPGPWNDSGSSVDDFDADCMMRMEWMPNGAADDDDELNANYKADAAFIAAANPSAILELIAQRAELLDLLRDVAKTFRGYEASHLAKGTVEGAQKAAANKYMAGRCEALIGRTQSTGEG